MSVQECEGLGPDRHLTNVCTSAGVGWAGLSVHASNLGTLLREQG